MKMVQTNSGVTIDIDVVDEIMQIFRRDNMTMRQAHTILSSAEDKLQKICVLPDLDQKDK